MEELLEAAKKAEAAEAHRAWAHLLAERVAAATGSRQLQPGSVEMEVAAAAQALLSATLPQQHHAYHGAPYSGGYAHPPSLGFSGLGLPHHGPPRVTSAPAYSAEHPSAPPSDDADADDDMGAGAPSRPARLTSTTATRARAVYRDSLSRAEATKEKNRRAQQRFRRKQKSKMETLEIEVVRLRAMVTELGGDPADALRDPDDLLQAPPQMEDHEHHAAAQDAQHQPQQQQIKQEEQPQQQQYHPQQQQQQQVKVMYVEQVPLSLDSMYADLEAWLEAAEGVARPAAVRFLQRWTEMADDARRLHYRSMAKRLAARDAKGVALWVNTQVTTRVGGAATPVEEASPRGGGSGGASGQVAPAQHAPAAAAQPQMTSR